MSRSTDMGGDDAVCFDRVSKRFGTVVALHDISLAIKRGEVMTLLGPSGCGKTTVLNLIAGFFSPDGGDIRIGGERVNDVPPYEREAGMMFQNYALFPHMTVAANIAYGLKARHVPAPEIARRVAEALTLVRLSGYEDRKSRELSGGQQQRVALARALVIDPKVLLLDEPFSALDKNLRASMQVELREIQRKLGVTTVFVTHDQSEALSLSDRIAVMSEGRICQLGTPLEIYRRPSDRFVASFVGDTNCLRGELLGVAGLEAVIALGGAEIKALATHLLDTPTSSPVDLFVRPERLRISPPGEPGSMTGQIVTQTYQGGHVVLQLASRACSDNLLLVRSAGDLAMTHWPPGTEVGISIDAEGCTAFPLP